MKDPRQGSAAIVFLVFYVLTLAWTLCTLFTRRGKRYIFSVFTFNIIRVGANIAALGWAIHLYDNFDWLIASLILGTEGELVFSLAPNTIRERADGARLLRSRPWGSVSPMRVCSLPACPADD